MRKAKQGLEKITLSEKVSGVSVMTSAFVNSIVRERRSIIIMGAIRRAPSFIVSKPSFSTSPVLDLLFQFRNCKINRNLIEKLVHLFVFFFWVTVLESEEIPKRWMRKLKAINSNVN